MMSILFMRAKAIWVIFIFWSFCPLKGITAERSLQISRTIFAPNPFVDAQLGDSIVDLNVCGGSAQPSLMFTVGGEVSFFVQTESIASQPGIRLTFIAPVGHFASSINCATFFTVHRRDVIERNTQPDHDIVNEFSIPESEGTIAPEVFLGTDVFSDPVTNHLFVPGAWNRIQGNPGLLEIDPEAENVISAIPVEFDFIAPPEGTIFLGFTIHPDTREIFVLLRNEHDAPEISKIRHFSPEGELLDIFDIPPLPGVLSEKPTGGIAIEPGTNNFIVSGRLLNTHEQFVFFVLAPTTKVESSWENYE